MPGKGFDVTICLAIDAFLFDFLIPVVVRADTFVSAVSLEL